MKWAMILMPLLWILSTCTSEPVTIEDKMQRILDKGIEKYGARGTSVAVIFPDNTIWAGTSGISQDTVTIKSDMLFAIGSVSKNMVAALTLRLVEEEILSLEDPLSKWLPEYEHIDKSITVRQLLNHTSGIYMYWENQEIWDDLIANRNKVFSPEEVLSYIKEPHFAPGKGWRYSNTNYLLLAMIIEKATSASLSSQMQKYLWEPLGITDMYLSIQQDIPDNMAHVYGDNWVFGNEVTDITFEPRASHESIGFGSSGVFTSASSLAKWSRALFEGEVINNELMDEMFQFVEFKDVANMSAYGLGVQRFPKRFSQGKMAVGHGGGNIGTTTYMVYLPEYHVSIVVMINAFPNKAADFIAKGLINATLKDLKAIGIVPYIGFFPEGIVIISFVLFIGFNVSKLIKNRRSLQNS